MKKTYIAPQTLEVKVATTAIGTTMITTMNKQRKL